MEQATSGCVILPSGSEKSSERQLAERLRVQELLRYFLPLYNSTPAGESKPRTSTDPSLTAFAQLCALKLNCQRSFISLIDDKQQYIIAEATKTTSLGSEEYTGDDDDALSFGQSSLDLFSGVCPSTIACFTSPDNSLNFFSEYVKASRSYYVMNDMSKLETFQDRPYIAGWPFMRYYAEVPLTSPSGFVIGTLCVVDNHARDGLDSVGIKVLAEVAATIMDHLELCSIRVQRNRAERMIQALGQFSEGNNSVREWWMKNQVSHNSEPAFRHLSIQERADIELGLKSGSGPLDLSGNSLDQSLEGHQFQLLDKIPEVKKQPSNQGQASEANSSSLRKDSESEPSSLRKDSSTDSTPPTSDPESAFTVGSKNKPLGPSSTSSVSITSVSNGVQNPPNNGPQLRKSNKNNDMLFRATNLMREGIGSSGVVLLDPRSIDGQLMSENELESVDGVSSKTFPISPGYHSNSLPGHGGLTTFARVISCSTRSGNASDMIQIPVRILAILLTQFPSGGVVSFDNRGILKATKLTSVWDEQTPSAEERKMYPFFDQEDGPGLSETDMAEIREITDALPGVTSLISFPLWDASRNKCISYGLAWTTDPTRVFGRQDFGYLNTFVNSITVELSRIEVMAANQAKSTFVSSISHELRSPLHGIMATLEVLRGSPIDPIYNDELATLEHCGSTLLDTIDNVLSFTKTNISTGKTIEGVAPSNSAQTVDLRLLVEEVVSISLSGNRFREIQDFSMRQNSVPASNSEQLPWLATPVTVICDLTPGHDWLFETDRASWKRVLLNLVGNSLKYTSSGFIVVKLEQEDTTPNPQISQDRKSSTFGDPVNTTISHFSYARDTIPGRKITLSVKDSGKGMSQDYLNNYLFKPFYQEDSMAPGTGLGLSIVAQLVTSFGGEINVVSELGQGTEITITATLSPLHRRKDSVTSTKMPVEHLGLKLGLLGLDTVPDLDHTTSGILPTSAKCNIALRSAIVNSATALGLSVTTVESIQSSDADILVISEPGYRQLSNLQIKSLRKSVLVLSSQNVKARGGNRTGHPNVVLLFEPFGPTKFHQALKHCLLVRKKIESHGLDSQIDSPAFPSTPNVPPSRELHAAADAGPINQQTLPRILLVEDNPINLKLLVMCIKQINQSFLTAVNGSLAVEAYRKYSSSIELILMDVQMPVMDGLEASRQVRMIEKSSGSSPAFIAALTALSSLEAKEAALENGIDFFLTKPVSLKRLKDLVKQRCSPTAIT